jgi:hypothetical protein
MSAGFVSGGRENERCGTLLLRRLRTFPGSLRPGE